MPSSNQDDSLLLIRCPSCGQRFKVGEDLRDRTVECGACEHRFKIHDEVIVRGKKFYPGERKNPSLNRFHRMPLAITPSIAVPHPVQYADAPDPKSFEPARPERVFAGLIGVAGMVFMALLLMFGVSRGGLLDGMTTDRRLLMAGFTSLLGTALLVFANPRARRKALGVGILLSAGLIALPLVFTEGSTPLAQDEASEEMEQAVEPEEVPAGDPQLEMLRNQIGTRPLEDEIERLAGEGSSKHAVGLWLRNLHAQHRMLVMEYILRITGADEQTHFYPRGNGDYLLVVTGIEQSLEELAIIGSKLGGLERTYPELAVVEIRVNNENFIEGPIEKLSNRADPAFYELNKRELESIDLRRAERAVQRLAEAEPKLYRSDITRKLIALLEEGGVDFKGEVCRALKVWSAEPGPAGEAALGAAQRLLKANDAVPEEMIALMVHEKNAGVVPVLDELWVTNPTKWESLYAEAGAPAEAAIIGRFPQTEGAVRHSAVRLLGRVGGTDSLPVLENARTGADSELQVLIEKSVAAIQERLAR